MASSRRERRGTRRDTAWQEPPFILLEDASGDDYNLSIVTEKLEASATKNQCQSESCAQGEEERG
jgi:hypothetical protein